MMTDDRIIIGRAEIAHRLGRSERTISRWIKRGILPASHAGLFDNGLLQVRASDLEALKTNFGMGEAA